MISIIGNFLLIAAMFSTIISMIFKNKLRLACFYSGSICIILSFFLLITAFIVSDFTIKNVFLHSSTILPLIYKISASWSSHEGSILMWLTLFCIVNIIYIYFVEFSCNTKNIAIIILSFIQFLFIGLIIFTSNPFPTFTIIPEEGLGLNPMLQDIALSIHPPLLYLGNVSYGLIFTNGCLLLHAPKERNIILATSKRISSFALMTLTAGIGLGSWWAYRELGWGGFWFFDPVENISLMPWLVGISLHHLLIITHKNGRFLRWSIILSMLSFLISLYGTCVVRSGVISSVHSFAFSPERGIYILSICCILTTFCVVWFIAKNNKLEPIDSTISAQEILIYISNKLWLSALLILVVALLYQLYCSFILDIEVSIDFEYFISVFVPIFIPILCIASISPTLKHTIKWQQILPIFITLIVMLCMYPHFEFGIITALISFTAIYLMLQTIIMFLLSPYSKKRIAFLLGHFGFGLLALSITFNSISSQEILFVGKIGDQVNDQNMLIKLENIKTTSSSNYYRQIAIFHVEDSYGNIVTLKPENRYYKVEENLSQEVDIFSFLSHDLYAVLNKVDQNIIHAHIYTKTYVSFIWLAVFIICCGFLMSIFGGSSKVRFDKSNQ